MKNSAIHELHSYWVDFFNSQDSKGNLNPVRFGEIPPYIQEKFQVEFYPEPFYGYFLDDMKNDILVPLINPGLVSEDHVKKLFVSDSFETSKSKWNNQIIERHLGWKKEDYLKREMEFIEILGKGKENWRYQKLNQCKKLVGNEIGFMHTIEFFPFHSHKWEMKKEMKDNWLNSLPSTKLAIHAIEEISKNCLVKHIIGIGKDWATILATYEDTFILESYEYLTGPKGGRSGEIFKYRPINSPNSLPIVIYSGVAMNLPATNKEAVSILKNFLELED